MEFLEGAQFGVGVMWQGLCYAQVQMYQRTSEGGIDGAAQD